VTAYRIGDYHEKRVREHLRGNGYHVWQSRGSKSPVDLIAIKPGQVLLVQVKAGTARLSHEDWNLLYELARQCGALAIEALVLPRKPPVFRRITGPHVRYGRTQLAVAFTVDEVELAAAKDRHPAGRHR
jgi:Holliday junction resolvase